MSEDLTENGRITEEGAEEVHSSSGSTLDINSPRHSLTTPPRMEDPVMEYFDGKGGVSDSCSDGDSPRAPPQDRDNESHHSRSYVTVSPPVSPGKVERKEGQGAWLWGPGSEGGRGWKAIHVHSDA